MAKPVRKTAVPLAPSLPFSMRTVSSLTGAKQRVNVGATHALLQKTVLGDSCGDGVAQLARLSKIGRFLGAVKHFVICQRVVGKPQEAGDLAFTHLLGQPITFAPRWCRYRPGWQYTGAGPVFGVCSLGCMLPGGLGVPSSCPTTPASSASLATITMCRSPPEFISLQLGRDEHDRRHDHRHQQGEDDEGARAHALQVLALHQRPDVMHSCPPGR